MLHLAVFKDTLAQFIPQGVTIEKIDRIDHEELGYVSKYRTVF